MKRRMLGLLTALALCLALLPGAALAEGEAAVSIGSVDLEAGKTYVTDGANGVKVWTESDGPLGADYLEFNGTTLTVHGQIGVNRGLNVSGDVTITGEKPSSLKINYDDSKPTDSFSHISGTLTLDGKVDFNAAGGLSSGNLSEGTLAATSDYSGDIVIKCGSEGITYDVQNSRSIHIEGLVNYSGDQSLTLKSNGGITFANATLSCPTATLEGATISSTGFAPLPAFSGDSLTINARGSVAIQDKDSPSAIKGSAKISAVDNVDISCSGVPVAAKGGTGGLTVTGSENVTISGASSDGTPLISMPVTFDKCREASIKDTGNGELVGKDVTLTSNVPIRVRKNSEEKLYIDGKLWAEGTDITSGNT